MYQPRICLLQRPLHTRGDLKEAVDFFKSARLLNPTRRFCAVYNAQELPLLLDKFKFLNDDEKKQLVSEAPAYIALANDIRHHAVVASKPIGFTQFHTFSISCHAGAAKFSLCRKGFSQLRNLLTDRQEQTLEDAVELSVMLAFNEASRNSLPDEVRYKLCPTL